MILKHKDIEIPADEPFKNCKLSRKTYAEVLTSMISSYADGFVLSLNNPWGTGKTTFVKMWRAQLANAKYTTLYFNAWENDFDADPMVALMSELGTLTDKKKDDTFNSLIEKAAVISHSIIPGLLKALAAKYIDTEVLRALLTDAGKGATDLLKDEIVEYAKKKKGLVDFRKDLEKYIKENTDGKPLVLFIDELDRCRPSYAVEVLEQVKHFFSVPGIVFVLSIDKTQLGNAIRGFYGSEQIDSREYLRRFIDLEFVLPAPPANAFVEYLYQYFGFDEYFRHAERNHRDLSYDKEEFVKFTNLLFTFNGLTLRQQEKLFSHARVTLRTFPYKNYLFPSVFILLIYLKDFHAGLYNQLVARLVPPQTILDELSKILPPEVYEDEQTAYIITEATLIKLYNNYYKEINYGAKIYKQDDDRNTILLIKPYTDKTEGHKKFINIMDHLTSRNGGDAKLSYLLNKIGLLDNFQDV
ncbi:P-loop NTPase fold protein [Pedobacter sp. PF22-3]|uniref:KAP family P-loop NTPase fold protein n=1 Tax=Pedobacter sp. PF22-3 TaxID=2994467 RepID=UPI0022458DF4|nr:P-loop NTPase fold protein [Pedobacter sp. PF22-3]MCX2492642.1 P-loop NTPase fold protein [Pedobacter sp. PF22-3]